MPGILDVKEQLVFYGAYHSNKTNVRIHMICVPLLIWTWQVMLATYPRPSFFPTYRYDYNSILSYEFSWAVVQAGLYLAYYLLLLPSAAVIYIPQAIISVLSATAFSRDPTNVKIAIALHVACWIAQFYGHGAHEKRAPALLDNLLGAIVLAPFFVHLEVLFEFGGFVALHKEIQNAVGKEILRIRSAEKQKEKGKARAT